VREHEIRCCLSLLDLPGAGAGTVLRLIEAAGSASAVLDLSPARLQALGLRAVTASALLGLDGRAHPGSAAPCEWLLNRGIAVLSVASADYPPLLRRIACPPPVLFVEGAVAALARPQVAVVGSRSPTASGRELALQFAAGLPKYGLTVTSGLALGIDSAAHLGALEAGGASVAVMGTGPDQVYPARNRRLAASIVEQGGALVTEFVPGTRPEPPNFPRRNRIISGLSLGVLVVEAALPSGSLLTAQCALEQDREVMAVPGPVRSPLSRGCHELLRNGAALIETPEDVLRALGDRFRPASPAGEARTHTAGGSAVALDALGADERRALDATGFEETPTETIVLRTGLGAAATGAALVRLELKGLIVCGAGGYARAP
jgi:DNA processing protein